MSFLWNRQTLKKISPPAAKFSDSDLEFNPVFNDDYVHKNNLTLNYTGKTPNFTFKGKATLDLKGQSLHKADPKTSSSVKLVTNVGGRNVETKFDNKGVLRLWSDLGTYDFGFPLTASWKVKSNTSFASASYAAMLEGKHGDVNTFNRLHVKNNGHSFWNSKVIYNRGEISVGGVTKVSLATFLISKLNVWGVYRHSNYSLFAELTNQGTGLKSNLTNQVLTLAATSRARNNNYAVKLAYNLLNKADPIEVSVGTVAKINNDTTVRAKIDNKTNLALSTKYVHSNNLTILVGTGVQLNESKTFTRDQVVPVPVGVSLNFTYL